MPGFAQSHAITDVCILVRDIEASIGFYTDKLGFELLHRAPGFADFRGAGVTLAVWDRTHISSHTKVTTDLTSKSEVLIAVRISQSDKIDEIYEELKSKGVEFTQPPANYPWNARCIYFHGPDDEVWEIYAWLEGGAPGAVEQ